MRILVTGGAGYIGSHTAVVLLEQGHDVIIVDNLCNSKRVAVRRVEELSGKQVAFYQYDACDEEKMRQVFSQEKIDAVIHFAGLKAVGESVSIPLKYYDNNLTSTLVLLKVMKEFGVGNFVFSSSATVYGNPASVPIREDFPLSATNPYGATKLMIERILMDCANADPGFHPVLLRYFNPVGAHESGKLGEAPGSLYHTDRGGEAGESPRVWQRLSHPRRHWRAGLYPCGGLGQRPRCGAAPVRERLYRCKGV